MKALMQLRFSRASFVNDRVTLCRLGAPLLYAYNANTFQRRLRGLHGLPPLGPTDAVIFRPCKVIHTWGLKKPIDVLFMDRHGLIIKLRTVFPKNIMACWRGVMAVEMAHGTAQRLGLQPGQTFRPDDGPWS